MPSFVEEAKENMPHLEQVECLNAEEEMLMQSVRDKEKEGRIIRDEISILESELGEQYTRVNDLASKGVAQIEDVEKTAEQLIGDQNKSTPRKNRVNIAH